MNLTFRVECPDCHWGYSPKNSDINMGWVNAICHHCSSEFFFKITVLGINVEVQKEQPEPPVKSSKAIPLTEQQKEIQFWVETGDSVWVENGIVYHAPPVDKEKFGMHKYKPTGTSDCEYGCGCWAGPTRSGGPVSPFGACPKNPKKKG